MRNPPRPQFDSITPWRLRCIVAHAFARGFIAAIAGTFGDTLPIKEATAHQLTRLFQEMTPHERKHWTVQRFRGLDGRLVAVLLRAPGGVNVLVLIAHAVCEAWSMDAWAPARCADLVCAVSDALRESVSAR